VNVDGVNDVNDIAQLFASNYRELYTSVPYDTNQLNDILNNANETIRIRPPDLTDCVIDLSDVHTAICKLNAHKKDGCQITCYMLVLIVCSSLLSCSQQSLCMVRLLKIFCIAQLFPFRKVAMAIKMIAQIIEA
jgi:hypothetical protein